MEQRIEEIGSIPVIVSILKKMGIDRLIDSVYPGHRNWTGLSYGQLAVLFIIYVIDTRTHTLSGMEEWINEHKTMLELTTGWTIGEKETTDDRLGRVVEVLGKKDERLDEFQKKMGQHLISAYELPTDVVRYDTTSFNVTHSPDDARKGILNFGHSKDRRPDLLQFKQGLGVLDPAGVPMLSETLAGNRADDPCYWSAWRRMKDTVGRRDFIFVADCKAASLETRTGIDSEGGNYLFPLPMTGNTPLSLAGYVTDKNLIFEDITINYTNEKGEAREVKVGIGCVVAKTLATTLEEGTAHLLNEQWFVVRSDNHAESQQKSLEKRLEKVEKGLAEIKQKTKDTVDTFRAKADQLIAKHNGTDFLIIDVKVRVTTEKRYLEKGRPSPNSPFELVEVQQFCLRFSRNEQAIKEAVAVMGWRIYVSNTTPAKMTLKQSVRYYRDQWIGEQGFHRFKRGSIPVLPLFLRIDERIKGLMVLLTIILQVLTLMEFVAHKTLKTNNDTLSGHVPGNPKMKTHRPTAERMLARFKNLYLLVTDTGTQVVFIMLGSLSNIQKKILAILELPESIYHFSPLLE